MPESKSRKKTDYTPPPDKKVGRKAVRIGSPRWIAPAMVVFFVVGLLWIVAYYIAPSSPPFSNLGPWNVAIGFGFIAVGFVLSTKWK